MTKSHDLRKDSMDSSTSQKDSSHSDSSVNQGLQRLNIFENPDPSKVGKFSTALLRHSDKEGDFKNLQINDDLN